MVATPQLDIIHRREIDRITAAVHAMADLAERMVRDAVLAMLSGNSATAAELAAADNRLDAMETACDAACVSFLARHAPAGRDLRLVTSALKIVNDLERIGDLAVNVAKQGCSALPLPVEVGSLARNVVDELQRALEALRLGDPAIARTLRTTDRLTDACNRQAFQRLIADARGDGSAVERALVLTHICRQLERIGDHSVNVAEMVVWQTEGTVLRHRPDVAASGPAEG